MFGWLKQKALKEHKLMLSQNSEASQFLMEEFKSALLRNFVTDRLQSEMESIHATAVQTQRAWNPSAPLKDEALECAWKTNRRLREVYGWHEDSKVWQFDQRFGGE